MDWIRISDTYVAEDGEYTFSVRWSRGAWHWRVFYIAGPISTANVVADNRQEHPSGFIDADSAIRAAERWYEQRKGES